MLVGSRRVPQAPAKPPGQLAAFWHKYTWTGFVLGAQYIGWRVRILVLTMAVGKAYPRDKVRKNRPSQDNMCHTS